LRSAAGLPRNDDPTRRHQIRPLKQASTRLSRSPSARRFDTRSRPWSKPALSQNALRVVCPQPSFALSFGAKDFKPVAVLVIPSVFRVKVGGLHSEAALEQLLRSFTLRATECELLRVTTGRASKGRPRPNQKNGQRQAAPWACSSKPEGPVFRELGIAFQSPHSLDVGSGHDAKMALPAHCLAAFVP
jgi:hypothetical protein